MWSPKKMEWKSRTKWKFSSCNVRKTLLQSSPSKANVKDHTEFKMPWLFPISPHQSQSVLCMVQPGGICNNHTVWTGPYQNLWRKFKLLFYLSDVKVIETDMKAIIFTQSLQDQDHTAGQNANIGIKLCKGRPNSHHKIITLTHAFFHK